MSVPSRPSASRARDRQDVTSYGRFVPPHLYTNALGRWRGADLDVERHASTSVSCGLTRNGTGALRPGQLELRRGSTTRSRLLRGGTPRPADCQKGALPSGTRDRHAESCALFRERAETKHLHKAPRAPSISWRFFASSGRTQEDDTAEVGLSIRTQRRPPWL
jgi:hypothetical protein